VTKPRTLGESCCREDRTQRFANALETVGNGARDVGDAAGHEVVEDLKPKFGAFGVFDPQTQHLVHAIGQCVQGQVDGLVAHNRVLSHLHAQGVEEYQRAHRLLLTGLPGADRTDEVRLTAVPYWSPRKAWISRTFIPQADMAKILS
jgi:hypothetical protein